MQCESAAVMFVENNCCISFSFHSVICERLATSRFTHRVVNAHPHVCEYLKDLNSI